MKKKMFALSLIILIVTTTVFAQAEFEKANQAGKVNVELAVMAGPTGFSSAKIARDNGEIGSNVLVNTSVYASPNEVVAKLTNGEVDVAALPTNLAAILYNKGVDVKLVAVIGNGMLNVLSTNPENWVNTKIQIPGGPSATPNQIASMLIGENGYDISDFDLDFSVTSSAQLSQLLIANKAETALLPEPFATMVLSKNPDMEVVLDIQKMYESTTGFSNYPMTVLVVQNKFNEENPQAVKAVLKAYEDSVAFVLANPNEAAQTIEEINIMPASMAAPAIPNCNLTYEDIDMAKAEVVNYYNLLFNFDAKSVGGKLPDEGFYL
ncbi:MAG: ABC transporter substrate-binding protein [Sphaerochaetaceae bacterium]|nr:ABC transporter substrate-binding protein [Sphaerochaetaceae bacterium]MDC7238017.1 ABC transporter substrate-binding protein [Sphaerochaetaceae bacterium]MDC7250495.1 ABC transporter substrate-binding protein [Sphaerochaetaceae bacterium]